MITLLKSFRYLSDVTLGVCNTTPVDLELKGDMKPVCLWPYPVPRVHKLMFKNKFEILVSLGVIEHTNDSEWRAPSFSQPKVKTNRLILLSDLRN